MVQTKKTMKKENLTKKIESLENEILETKTIFLKSQSNIISELESCVSKMPRKKKTPVCCVKDGKLEGSRVVTTEILRNSLSLFLFSLLFGFISFLFFYNNNESSVCADCVCFSEVSLPFFGILFGVLGFSVFILFLDCLFSDDFVGFYEVSNDK